MPRLLKADEITRQLDQLEGWDWLDGTLQRNVVLASFVEAIRAVNAIADEAEQMDHHPDIAIHGPRLDFALSTHSEGGVTQYDIELAHRIEAVLREQAP